ncbi:putative ribonuclease H-like domain-containing protein [Tanacetum coccineum]
MKLKRQNQAREWKERKKSNSKSKSKSKSQTKKVKVNNKAETEEILDGSTRTHLMDRDSPDVGFKPSREEEKMDTKDPGNENEASGKDSKVPSTEELREDQRVNQELDAIHLLYAAGTEMLVAVVDMNNLDAFMPVSHIPTTRIHKDHPVDQIIGDLNSAPQIRRMTKNLKEHGLTKKDNEALQGSSWIEDMQDKLLQFIYKRTKQDWLLKGTHKKKGIDYVEVFAPVARIEAIRLFLAYAYNKDFVVYRRMLRVLFLYGLQVKQKEDGIFISQDKYVTEILKKFGFSDVKTASTPMETHKPLLKDADGEDIDEHMYRSMIGSLMYLTSSRPDIMFAVCVCARFQVNPKVSHLHAVKRIFRYLKGQPKLGLWYPKDSPFDLVAYTDSDYAGASLDRKSTTGGCQFLGCRLISWQCKKQTVVANSTTEAEYVAASSCYGQVLWIQNQLLDYGYNFMHTKIYIDNESTICIVKNPVFHSKTKHIEIRHHFIRDSNEKKLIQMIKIHTDKNVADLLTKAFDKGIGVNAGDSKLMLLGINLLLLEKVNAARLNLLLLVHT